MTEAYPLWKYTLDLRGKSNPNQEVMIQQLEEDEWHYTKIWIRKQSLVIKSHSQNKAYLPWLDATNVKYPRYPWHFATLATVHICDQYEANDRAVKVGSEWMPFKIYKLILSAFYILNSYSESWTKDPQKRTIHPQNYPSIPKKIIVHPPTNEISNSTRESDFKIWTVLVACGGII